MRLPFALFSLLCVTGSIAQQVLQTLPAVDLLEARQYADGILGMSDLDTRLLELDMEQGGLLLQWNRPDELGPGLDAFVHPNLLARLDTDETLHLALNGSPEWTSEPCRAISANDSLFFLAPPLAALQATSLADPGDWNVILSFESTGLGFSTMCASNDVLWFHWESAPFGPLLWCVRLDNPQQERTTVWLHDTPSFLAGHGSTLLACLGEAGLVAAQMDGSSIEVGDPWTTGHPVVAAVHWRDELWFLATGGSRILLVELAGTTPMLRGQWNRATSATRLSMRGDTLTMAEGAGGISLHLAREEQGAHSLERLARYNGRPHALSFASPTCGGETGEEASVWMLDRNQGYRRIVMCTEPNAIREDVSLELPLPVEGGDVRAGLLAGCRNDAGLRYYEIREDGLQLRGVHPTDPVELLAWGPDDRIAYVTPSGFVAIKQANRSPWFLLHHGTINLQLDPSCVSWVGDQLWLGSWAGDLAHVDAGDMTQPRLVERFQFDEPVTDLDTPGPWNDWSGTMLIAAGRLGVVRHADQADSIDAIQWYPETPGLVRSCSIEQNGLGGLAVAGLESPHEVRELTLPLQAGDPITWSALQWDLPAAPAAIEHVGYGRTLVACTNGDLLQLQGSGSVTVAEPEPRLPGFNLSVHPNPFNPVTTLTWHLESTSRLRITLHDLLGREIRLLAAGNWSAGEHELRVDARGLASGVYIARIKGERATATARLLLLK